MREGAVWFHGAVGDTGLEHDTNLRPDEIDPDRPRPLETPWGAFALYRIGDEVLASQSFCPHLAGPLFQGTLMGDTITCPWHRWRFSLRTGARVDFHLGGGKPLALLEVSLGPRGTLVLRPPGCGAGPAPELPRPE